MDGKMTVRAAVLALTLTMMLPVTTVMAEDYICDATQASSKELPMLSADCPIGDGLWGNKKPTNPENMFWVQCGILDKPMPLTEAKGLYREITSDVWMKKEARGYRCLIGPYENYRAAKKDWRMIITLAKYNDAFIREVKVAAAPSAQPAAQAPKPAAPAKAKPAPAMSATVPAAKAQQPKPAAKPQPKPEPAPVATTGLNSAPKVTSTGNIEVRRKAQLNQHTYVVPYVNDGSDTFYMEHDKPWNRMSYSSALGVCKKLGMRLANHDEWQAILQTEELSKNKWPVHLPYWGMEQKGFFTSGKVTQLKGSSLLNVLCIQP
ncbi:SPOR domain-containing protein [Vibrio sp. SCSIO 43136]|uniref:SPOR domain-containing protein n=1 Tax=Vibrio sp. SCSIO 43136 TaxID=2819101 RepID=UPI0020751673|nr:SPOR domain-containing protein [Vibrio sp. SCSIO 43136]USD65233.1 SPOR domain-containing protein [Vibrio sp. SCSIO 43136]